jgi:hypothetical protein
VNQTPNPAPSPRRSRPVAPVETGQYSCLQCPACGSEACPTLQDLGMYCDTLCAASEATRAEKHPKSRPAAA